MMRKRGCGAGGEARWLVPVEWQCVSPQRAAGVNGQTDSSSVWLGVGSTDSVWNGEIGS